MIILPLPPGAGWWSTLKSSALITMHGGEEYSDGWQNYAIFYKSIERIFQFTKQ